MAIIHINNLCNNVKTTKNKYNTSYNICNIYFVESATHKKCKTTKHQRNAVPKTPMHRYHQHCNASGLKDEIVLAMLEDFVEFTLENDTKIVAVETSQ